MLQNTIIWGGHLNIWSSIKLDNRISQLENLFKHYSLSCFNFFVILLSFYTQVRPSVPGRGVRGRSFRIPLLFHRLQQNSCFYKIQQCPFLIYSDSFIHITNISSLPSNYHCWTNTRPHDPPLEKPVCRSGSNS